MLILRLTPTKFTQYIFWVFFLIVLVGFHNFLIVFPYTRFLFRCNCLYLSNSLLLVRSSCLYQAMKSHCKTWNYTSCFLSGFFLAYVHQKFKQHCDITMSFFRPVCDTDWNVANWLGCNTCWGLKFVFC